MESEIGCTLSKFVDGIQLCGEVDTLEGRDTIQRDLDKLQSWAHASLMKFKMAKCKALNLVRAIPSTNLGWVMSELRVALCRSTREILTLYFALVRPHFEYCIHLRGS